MKKKIIKREKKEIDTITKLQNENKKLKLKIAQQTKKQLALDRHNFNLEKKLDALQREYREFREKNKPETHEERVKRLRLDEDDEE